MDTAPVREGKVALYHVLPFVNLKYKTECWACAFDFQKWNAF